MSKKIHNLTGISILSALIIVLTMVAGGIRIGPFSITLALVPIIIGSALYGASAGAILGAVMGITVIIFSIATGDIGVMTLLNQNPLACILVCILKSTLAGWIAGLVYGLVAKKSPKAGVIAAGITCPVVNTTVFILGMILFFFSAVEAGANGQKILNYAITGMAGINFLIELAINMALASVITYIIRYAANRN